MTHSRLKALHSHLRELIEFLERLIGEREVESPPVLYGPGNVSVTITKE
jgi:hypothetical protein